MANRIKGITVEIGGDTTGLDKALKGVNSSLTKTQSALSDVNRLLKLDPSNTVLVAQKQELLKQAISQTEEKLSALESAQEQVAAAFARGDIGEEKYQAFQREVEATRGKLNKYKSDLSSLQTEQDALSTNTARLEKLFQATETEVDDYADVLGTQLVSAIKSGSASSDQLKSAIDKIGKAATGGKADVRQLTEALDAVDDGTAVRSLIGDLNKAGDAAEDAADDVGEIAEVAKGAAMVQAAEQLSAVGGKVKEIGSSAVSAYSETETADSKVNAYFGETGTEAQKSANVVKNVYGSGVGDSMDSVSNAVITVRKNLGNLSQTDLTNLTKQAITLDEVYGIDMNETLRGVNALMKQYGLTAQQAMDYIVKGTQNGLDKTDELGDNISEYSGKFAQAGYSAKDYFQLLQNGLKGGAYNLDKVNDAINEVTTRLADGTIGDSIVSDIANCKNEQDALNMAATAFGTMAEDGNLKFITSLTSVGNTYDDVTGSAKGMFDAATTPMQALEGNTRRLRQALVPLGEKLANTIIPPLVTAITKISGWFGKLWEKVCAGIGAMVEKVKAWFSGLWEHLGKVWDGICDVVQTAVLLLGSILKAALTVITLPFQLIWENCKGIITSAWNAIKNTVSTGLAAISKTISTVMNAIKTVISTIWTAISTKISTVLNSIKAVVTTVFNAIKSVASTAWNGVKSVISTVVDGIKGKVSSVFNEVKSTVASVFGGIKSAAASAWNGVKNAIVTPVEAAKAKVKNALDKISGFFAGCKLQLPHIKLPHFHISGSLSVSPPSVPHLSVDWYKEGGIMASPTIFGVNGSSLMAGGEAGKEAILPLKGFYDQLENILASRLNTGTMERYLAVIAENSGKGIYLDDGTLIGKLLPTIDGALGKTQKLQRRLRL